MSTNYNISCPLCQSRDTHGEIRNNEKIVCCDYCRNEFGDNYPITKVGSDYYNSMKKNEEFVKRLKEEYLKEYGIAYE